MNNESTNKNKINFIDYNDNIRKQYLISKKGKQTQTNSLNINIKTINKNQLLKIPELNNQQKNIVADYILEKANFQSTRKLFGVQNTTYCQQSHLKISFYMKDFYQSSNFIQRILVNQNMDFQNKINLLKFIQKIRLSSIYPQNHKFWKQKF